MPEEELSVSVLPAGRWGTAFARVVASRGHNTQLFFRNERDNHLFRTTHQNERYFPGITLPDNITSTEDLADAVNSADVLVLAAPSRFLREFFRQIKSMVDFHKDIKIICLTKGLEEDTNLRMSQVLEQELPHIVSCLAVISGPNFASEIIQGKPAATVVASKNISFERFVQDNFSSPYFRIYRQHDLIGVELGGAFKNVIAIAAGVSDGIDFGENARSGLITRGLEEMKRLGIALGGQERTFDGLSGQGDLWLTCTSQQSRNHEFGVELARGRSIAELLGDKTVYEGYYSTRAMIRLAKQQRVAVPIAEVVYAVLYNNLSIGEAIEKLLSRALVSENGD